MKCELIRDMRCDPDDEFPDGVKPKGTIIDHHQAWILVRQGVAKPADQECADKAGVSPLQLAVKAKAYDRVAKGIHPDDYKAYNAGFMDGYNADGTWKPGPNHAEYLQQQAIEETDLILDPNDPRLNDPLPEE